jgi:NAD(P)-dependent dehydrogenase (short-subunit alcohol dehydrogenase family)/acyl carrier protein
VEVAAVNGPAAVVVSGEPEAVAAVVARCQAAGVRASVLPVDYASHTGQVEEIAARVREAAAGVAARSCAPLFCSTVTGEPVDGAGLAGEYWVDNLRRPVLFARAVRALADRGHRVFVEVGPHPVLTGPVHDSLTEHAAHGAAGDAAGGAGASPAGGAGGGPAGGAGGDWLVEGTLRRGHDDLTQLLASAAGLHTHGVAVDWTALFAGTGARTVELPTYAFQRRRYWLEPARGAGGSGGGGGLGGGFWEVVERGDAAALAGVLGVGDRAVVEGVLPGLASWWRRERDRSRVAGWRHRVVWRPVQPSVQPPVAGGLSDCWLVVAPAGGLGDWCATVLAGHGAQVVRVVRVEGGGMHERAQIGRVLAERGGGTPVRGVLVAGEAAGCLLAVVQALGDAGVQVPVWAVTRGAVRVDPADRLDAVEQAMVWGLGRVVRLEQPRCWGGLVDLPARLDEAAGRWLAAVVAGCGEDEVAVRPSGLFACRLVPAPAPPPGGGAGWRASGTVLVTGGTGALGARVARWAASRGAGHVLVLSRRGAQAEGAAGLGADLARSGARVSLVACDVADREALRAVLASIPADCPLTTVVHTAGVGLPAPVESATPEHWEEVVRAKVDGARLLDDLARCDSLRHFVLFSSAAGVWGSGSQGAYAAANAYLDALCERRRSAGLPATSLAWGPWAGGGMTDEEARRWLDGRGVRALDPDLAIIAMEETVAAGESCLVLADVDWERFASVYVSSRPGRLLAELVAPAEPEAPADPGLAARLAGMTGGERRRCLSDLVREQVAAVLGHESGSEVDTGRAFRELGFDSLMAVELRNRLNQATGLRLPATLVFDHPTPTELAVYLGARLIPDQADSNVEPDAEESEIRRALATLPLATLRRAGVLDALKKITDPGGHTAVPVEGSVSIDEMDAASLLLLAKKNSVN